jgi:hypothetical protein
VATPHRKLFGNVFTTANLPKKLVLYNEAMQM